MLKHSLLIIDLGFHLVLDPTLPYGFDSEGSLPCDFWFRTMLRTFGPSLLRSLLAATVRDLREEIPGMGQVVSFHPCTQVSWGTAQVMAARRSKGQLLVLLRGFSRWHPVEPVTISRPWLCSTGGCDLEDVLGNDVRA